MIGSGWQNEQLCVRLPLVRRRFAFRTQRPRACQSLLPQLRRTAAELTTRRSRARGPLRGHVDNAVGFGVEMGMSMLSKT